MKTLNSLNYLAGEKFVLRIVKSVKSFLKKFPAVIRLKRKIWPTDDRTRGSTKHNILHTFPAFLPYSSGPYSDRARLTIQSINRTHLSLRDLLHSVRDQSYAAKDVTEFSTGAEESSSASRLKLALDSHGSDKANTHNYHHLYGAILADADSIRLIFEVGLGTNNTDVISNMGKSGTPGASLRAFRDFLPNADIYGADVDKRILFEEDRIKTFFVDQTDPSSFRILDDQLPNDFDLIIDDGLHSPDANIETLKFGLKKIRVGGWVVIEDINESAKEIWEVVAGLLPKNVDSYIVSTESGALMFAVQRVS